MNPIVYDLLKTKNQLKPQPLYKVCQTLQVLQSALCGVLEIGC